jgi:hypothetical protein
MNMPKTLIATKTSPRTFRSVPDTAVRIEGKGASLAEMRNAVDGALLNVLGERPIP